MIDFGKFDGKQARVLTYISFIIVLIVSFLLIQYSFEYYSVSKYDDFCIPYGRDFFHPEHGRYLSTFLCSLFGEHLPFLLNMHPNNVIRYITNPFIGVLMILFCILTANSLFISSKPNNNLLKFDFGNVSYLIAFIFTFVLVFNNNFIFSKYTSFLLYDSFVVFFDYVLPLLFLIPLLGLIADFIAKKVFPSGKVYILILFLTFFSGISNESVNLPMLIALSAFILVFIFNKDKINKNDKRKFLIMTSIYFFSLFCYYISPVDDPINYKQQTLTRYILNDFGLFINVFAEKFCLKLLILSLPLIFILILILRKTRDKLFTGYIFTVFVSLFLFYFFSFLRGYIWDGIFLIESYKCLFCARIIILCLLFLSAGYYFDACTPDEHEKNRKKIIALIIILFFFFGEFISVYPGKISGRRNYAQTERLKAYIIEKIAINTLDGDEIILPLRFKMNTFDVSFENQAGWKDGWLIYLKILHYPELKHKKHIIFTTDFEPDYSLFSNDELKNPDFGSLLKHKIHKNVTVKNDGKVIIYCD